MRKMLSMALVVMMVLGIVGLAMAQSSGPSPGYGPHGGMMGRGAGGPGGGPCRSQQGGTPATAAAIDDAKAKEIAAEYVTKNLPGYRVEKLVKFDRRRGSMYQAEVKGPQGELQYLHINPFGTVRSFGAGRVL